MFIALDKADSNIIHCMAHWELAICRGCGPVEADAAIQFARDDVISPAHDKKWIDGEN